MVPLSDETTHWFAPAARVDWNPASFQLPSCLTYTRVLRNSPLNGLLLIVPFDDVRVITNAVSPYVHIFFSRTSMDSYFRINSKTVESTIFVRSAFSDFRA